MSTNGSTRLRRLAGQTRSACQQRLKQKFGRWVALAWPPSPPWWRLFLFLLVKAIIWETELFEEQVIERREAMIAKIEEADSRMRLSGLAAEWFTGVTREYKGSRGRRMASCWSNWPP